MLPRCWRSALAPQASYAHYHCALKCPGSFQNTSGCSGTLRRRRIDEYARVQDDVLPGMIKNRYSTYSTGVGKKIRDGKVQAILLATSTASWISHVPTMF